MWGEGGCGSGVRGRAMGVLTLPPPRPGSTRKLYEKKVYELERQRTTQGGPGEPPGE